jgi:hypothetical protein
MDGTDLIAVLRKQLRANATADEHVTLAAMLGALEARGFGIDDVFLLTAMVNKVIYGTADPGSRSATGHAQATAKDVPRQPGRLARQRAMLR